MSQSCHDSDLGINFLTEISPHEVSWDEHRSDAESVKILYNYSVELSKYADRIKVLHIKDRNVLGMSGMMNFEQIFKQAYTNGIKDYFVELERMPEGKTQFEGVKGCANFLLKSSFVK